MAISTYAYLPSHQALPLVTNLFPESARSVEILNARKTATVEHPRELRSLDYSHASAETSEPESPLLGRYTKSEAALKARDKRPDTVTALGFISMISMTDGPAGVEENLSEDVVAIRSRQSSASSSGYFTAGMVMEYSHQARTQSHNSTTSSLVREEVTSKAPIDGPNETRQSLLRIAAVLQRAARQARDQESLSQATTFRAALPLLLFVLVLLIGTLLPRHYSALQERYRTQCGAVVSVLIIGGVGSALLLLRGMIWVVGVLGESFCEMDLNSTLRQGECRDIDGTRMKEADLLIGSFLLG